jgi:hypothetical protein
MSHRLCHRRLVDIMKKTKRDVSDTADETSALLPPKLDEIHPFYDTIIMSGFGWIRPGCSRSVICSNTYPLGTCSAVGVKAVRELRFKTRVIPSGIIKTESH